MEKDEQLIARGKSVWLELCNRYFEAETTDDEERLLRRFAATAIAQNDPDFSDLCAVMSVVAVGKLASSPRRKTLKLRRWMWAAACAAVLAGAWLVVGYPSKNVCVAYVDGTKITDRDAVLALMENSWNDIGLDGSTVENQLTDLFNTIE